MMDIRGKFALITGAASGIGQATATIFAERGVAKIVLVDLDEAGARETARRVEARGAEAVVEIADVSNAGDLQAIFERADLAGGLDIVFNNAGISGGPPFVPDAPVAKIEQVIGVNLTAVILGTQFAVQAMARRGGGVVVNTCSGSILAPVFHDSIYVATKVAVLKFTQCCVGLKDSHNVRVNAILPGMTRTPMIMGSDAALKAPAGAFVSEPEEIAEGVVALVEDEAKAGDYIRISRNPGSFRWSVVG